jgi:hypothetical protein
VNVRLLIDGIVRQTTVLIAQLSTAAGVRAPLAHIADQVFLDLSREIEAQGVSRVIAADMFGMALRSYQKKTQRLAESATDRNRTLWEGIVDFLRDGSKSRSRILERFRHDGEREVGAVLADLVMNGLVYSTGRGDDALYGLSSESDRHVIASERDARVVANVLWLELFLAPAKSEDELVRRTGTDPGQVKAALEILLRERRVARDPSGDLYASNVLIPIGSAEGWEAALLDHFRAVAAALGTKVARGRDGVPDDQFGGSTLSFTVYDGHPHETEVRGLLKAVREQVFALWNRVAEYNRAHSPPETAAKVTFYVGQMVTDVDAERDGELPDIFRSDVSAG